MEGRELVGRIEGYLLVAATHEEGRTAAERFCARLVPWLTEAQREEVERRFEAEYVALARLSWQRTAERAEELRTEYEERYRALRRRLLGCGLLACAGLMAVAGIVVALR
ncbi:hypothetical protein [Streptomyces sp. P17]|uniref:hypothetical protein n=1 Tax=Streptomyces sp. P17 TaxID=3074716 RepID=UPI0028F4170B|nr:hypothetical protein [Streptomyces sp. P17]MDT9701752.1 hypothetical protein [Streptomyces sp. P17]